jgi:hypothetical protein
MIAPPVRACWQAVVELETPRGRGTVPHAWRGAVPYVTLSRWCSEPRTCTGRWCRCSICSLVVIN